MPQPERPEVTRVSTSFGIDSTPVQGQDIFTMSVSEYVEAEVGTQYALIGYVIGLRQLAAADESVAPCIASRLTDPLNDGLGDLSERMRSAVAIAEADPQEKARPVVEVLILALTLLCG